MNSWEFIDFSSEQIDGGDIGDGEIESFNCILCSSLARDIAIQGKKDDNEKF